MDKPKIFISYAREDESIGRQITAELRRLGADTWLDRENLLPGQHWRSAIHKAISESDFVVMLLSNNSVTKHGFVQKEVKLALDTLDEFPDESIFIVPVRIDDCIPKNEKLRDLHWVDFFDDKRKAVNSIARAIGLKPNVERAINQSNLVTPSLAFVQENLNSSEFQNSHSRHMVQISCAIPEAMKDAMSYLADNLNVSKVYMIRRAISLFLSLVAETQAGSEIIIRRPSGEQQKLILP